MMGVHPFAIWGDRTAGAELDNGVNLSDPDFGVNRYRVSAAPCDQVGQSFGIVVLVRQGRIEVDIGMYILHLYLQHAENFSQAFHVLVLLCLCASVWAPHRSSIVLSV